MLLTVFVGSARDLTAKKMNKHTIYGEQVCDLFALAFLKASFSLLHRADETQSARNSCPRLQPYFIGFCRVGISQSQLFYAVIFTFTFTIIQAFPLYKAYMLGFGQVRKGS